MPQKKVTKKNSRKHKVKVSSVRVLSNSNIKRETCPECNGKGKINKKGKTCGKCLGSGAIFICGI